MGIIFATEADVEQGQHQNQNQDQVEYHEYQDKDLPTYDECIGITFRSLDTE